MMTLEEAVEKPMISGLTTRKNSTKPVMTGQLCPQTVSGVEAVTESMTAPRSVAENTSAAPVATEASVAIDSPRPEPFSAQPIKRSSVCGGGPSAGRNASIWRAKME